METIVRYEARSYGDAYGLRIEFGAVYLRAPKDHQKDLVTREDGMLETTWAMTAEVQVRRGLYETGAWRVEVSQGAIGSQDPETMRARIRVALLACESAAILREAYDSKDIKPAWALGHTVEGVTARALALLPLTGGEKANHDIDLARA